MFFGIFIILSIRLTSVLEVLVGDFVAEDGTHYNEENPGSVLIKGAMPVKYGEDPDATGEESQVDWIVYRYADVLLCWLRRLFAKVIL